MKIEKYYIDEETKKAKCIMDQNTAKEIKIAIIAFAAGLKKGGEKGEILKSSTGAYIADTYLPDDESKKLARKDYWDFLETVQEKIIELNV